MVQDKAKSGDPDFDDKVPADEQAGKTVRAGDGREILVTESTGPINPDGSHANIENPDAGDNRPAPGEVAQEASTAQVAAEPPAGAPKRGPIKSGSK